MRNPDGHLIEVGQLVTARTTDRLRATAGTRFIVFMDATAAERTQQLNGREPLAPCSTREHLPLDG
jgi:hypothetical protein